MFSSHFFSSARGVVSPDASQSTPSATPLLHHSSLSASEGGGDHNGGINDDVDYPDRSDINNTTNSLRQNRSFRQTSANRGDASGAAKSSLGAAGSGAASSAASSTVPRCRSVEDDADFAIVSIPVRRARIAKMGEGIEFKDIMSDLVRE